MGPVRRAVIDVGTNSIKLLVADVAGHEVQPVVEESKQTRLGRGFYETHRLQPEAIATTAKAVARFGERGRARQAVVEESKQTRLGRGFYETHRLQPGAIATTAKAVAKFAEMARERQAVSIRAIATSAARDAVNQKELTCAIEQAAGLKVEIISGEQEADWAFQGVTTDPELAQQPLLLLDVGGGSTEFILGQGGHKHFSQSVPLGTVRLMEKIPHSDPPRAEEWAACRRWLKDFLEAEVGRKLRVQSPKSGVHSPQSTVHSLKSQVGEQGLRLVGTGGTASILARMEGKMETYDRARIEAVRLSLDRVRWHAERLWGLPLESRKEIVGLPKNRADVILTGVAI